MRQDESNTEFDDAEAPLGGAIRRKRLVFGARAHLIATSPFRSVSASPTIGDGSYRPPISVVTEFGLLCTTCPGDAEPDCLVADRQWTAPLPPLSLTARGPREPSAVSLLRIALDVAGRSWGETGASPRATRAKQ